MPVTPNYSVQWDTGEGMARGIMMAGQAIGGGLQQLTDTRKEVDFLNASWDYMKQQDPALAQFDEKFASGSASAKRGLVTQAQTRLAEMVNQQKLAMQEDSRMRLLQQEQAGRVALQAQELDVRQSMQTQAAGDRMRLMMAERMPLPGTKNGYYEAPEGGRMLHYRDDVATGAHYRLPQADDGFGARVDPDTGAMLYELGGTPVSPSNLLFPQADGSIRTMEELQSARQPQKTTLRPVKIGDATYMMDSVTGKLSKPELPGTGPAAGSAASFFKR